ncbi:MAG: FtsX-like permease family protein, partial [bacterium]|nr:FtsX-like permease family protein [bacterium]
YSSINIIGFSIGMACSILIALFIYDELNFDKHNEKADRIYRVGSQFGANRAKGAFTAPPMAAAFVSDFPEIENIVRLSLWPRNMLVSNGEKKFVEKRIIYADSSIFNVFTIPMLQGDPNTALREPNTIVITESMASKYFGNDEPVGKVLNIDSEGTPYLVKGLVNDCSKKSHFQFDFIISLITKPNSRDDGWMGHTYFTYIVLQENYQPEQLEAKFPEFIKRHYGPQFFSETGMDYENYLNEDENFYGYWLQPLLDIHLATEGRDQLSVTGDITFVYVFSIIAVFILLIACINFMNLSTARYTKRSKEVGLRKVLGSNRRQLAVQFISESVILSIVSLVIAVIMINFALPVFNSFTEKQMVFDITGSLFLFPGLMGFALLVGMIAGSYPALFLSSIKPISALKGGVKEKTCSNLSFRRTLVVFQFAISIVILIGAFVVYNQLTYIKNEELGFNKENIIVIHRSKALGQKY